MSTNSIYLVYTLLLFTFYLLLLYCCFDLCEAEHSILLYLTHNETKASYLYYLILFSTQLPNN